MSQNTLTLSAEAKDKFLSGDEGRGEIRKTASELFPEAATILIVDEEGNLFDTVGGINSSLISDDTDDRAVIVTDEEVQEKALDDALNAADLARVEAEIKPLVIARLKDEARNEIREEYRNTIRELRASKTELTKQVVRLKEGMLGADRLLTEARNELSIAGARFANLSEEYETLKAEQSK